MWEAFHHRRLSSSQIIIVGFALVILVGALVLMLPVSSNAGTASAIGTVGLTLGITPSLHTVSRLILISLMFLGRVGGLTLIFATLSANKNTLSRLPLEKITVG